MLISSSYTARSLRIAQKQIYSTHRKRRYNMGNYSMQTDGAIISYSYSTVPGRQWNAPSQLSRAMHHTDLTHSPISLSAYTPLKLTCTPRQYPRKQTTYLYSMAADVTASEERTSYRSRRCRCCTARSTYHNLTDWRCVHR